MLFKLSNKSAGTVLVMTEPYHFFVDFEAGEVVLIDVPDEPEHADRLPRLEINLGPNGEVQIVEKHGSLIRIFHKGKWKSFDYPEGEE